MKEFCLVFTDINTGKELCAYTLRGAFSGEMQATKEALALENHISIDEIEVKAKIR